MVATTARPATTALAFLQHLFLTYHPRDFAVRFWDGSAWEPEDGQPARFTLVLQHPGALRALFFPPSELSFGEAYIYNDIDLLGEIEAAFPVAEALLRTRFSLADRLGQAKRLFDLPRTGRRRPRIGGASRHGESHSIVRDRQAVGYHYNRSNDFYRLWLDREMVYSCAYFASPDDDLDQAQQQKLDYVCRKLRLQPGDRLLDIGCGWGALLRFAARHYGADATGITLSEEQAMLANERIRAAGLQERCRVAVRDYRELQSDYGFDRLVSVGMVEHVGEPQLPGYFAHAYRLLRPGGAFLNHGIARAMNEVAVPGPSFVDRYVFPDGQLSPVSTTLRAAEQAGFEVRDVESLREQYVLTLRHWVRRLESHSDEAVAATDDMTYRIWRLYMAGAAHSFVSGQLNIYQTLLVKPINGASGLPLTRRDWYR